MPFYLSLLLFLYIFFKYKENRKISFFQILIFSTFFYFFSLLWLVKFLKVYGGLPLIFGSLAILVLSIYLSLYFSLSYLFSSFFSEKIFVFIFPLFFWIFEYLRGIVLTGFSWNPIHLPLLYFPFFVQGLSIFGSFGFSAVILFFFLGIVFQVIEKKINYFWFLFFIVLFIYNIFWINYEKKESSLKIAIVQVDINELERFKYGEDFLGLRKGIDVAKKIKEKIGLLVFPESLFIVPYEKNYFIFKGLQELSYNFPVLFNANLDERDKSYNSAILIENGEIKNIYRKTHLVPFGEYIPLRGFFEKIGFKKIARSLLDFDEGKEVGIFDFKERFGVSICYEIIFPEISRKEIKEGAKFLVVLTNDSWYGDSLGPYQHFLLAKAKAIEFGKPLARSALTGISAFIDSKGRNMASLKLFEEGFIISEIKVSNRKTIYYYLRDFPPFLIILFFVFKKFYCLIFK